MPRNGVLDGAQNVAVVKLGKIARQSALNADFGGAELPGFDGFARHIVERVEVRVGLARAAAEGAELASHKTDVGEIDVAVHHVGDDVAREFGAQHVGGDQQARRSSPSELARAYDSSSDSSSPFCVSRTFSKEERSAGVRRGAMSDQSSEGKDSSSESAISRCTMFSVGTV